MIGRSYRAPTTAREPSEHTAGLYVFDPPARVVFVKNGKGDINLSLAFNTNAPGEDVDDHALLHGESAYFNAAELGCGVISELYVLYGDDSAEDVLIRGC